MSFSPWHWILTATYFNESLVQVIQTGYVNHILKSLIGEGGKEGMLWRHISTECDTDQAIFYAVYDKMKITCASYILLFADG